MEWSDLQESKLITRIIQKKAGRPVILTLHPVAIAILSQVRSMIHGECTGKVFTLPRADGANKALEQWVSDAGINKHITLSCARLSFSILLKDKQVDDPTIAYLLGHSTAKQVPKTYKRHRPKDQTEAINHLPSHKKTVII